MRLKREKKLYLRADENSPWLPLEAGVYRLGSRQNSTKHRWFPVGKEAAPQEVAASGVKVISLQFHLREDDKAQDLLLNCGRNALFLKQEYPSENGEIIGKIAVCTLDSVEELEGNADEAISYRISLIISQEIPVDVKV